MQNKNTPGQDAIPNILIKNLPRMAIVLLDITINTVPTMAFTIIYLSRQNEIPQQRKKKENYLDKLKLNSSEL